MALRKVATEYGGVVVFDDDTDGFNDTRFVHRYVNGQDIDPNAPGAPVAIIGDPSHPLAAAELRDGSIRLLNDETKDFNVEVDGPDVTPLMVQVPDNSANRRIRKMPDGSERHEFRQRDGSWGPLPDINLNDWTVGPGVDLLPPKRGEVLPGLPWKGKAPPPDAYEFWYSPDAEKLESVPPQRKQNPPKKRR